MEKENNIDENTGHPKTVKWQIWKLKKAVENVRALKQLQAESRDTPKKDVDLKKK